MKCLLLEKFVLCGRQYFGLKLEGKKLRGDLGLDGKIIFGSGQEPMAGSCDDGNELLVCKRRGIS
jgi:hypothetical protein